MPESSCYLNGTFCPIESAVVPISDLGFVHGVTVTEQLRTTHGRPWLLDRHLDRFEKGLALLQIQLAESRSRIESIIHQLVEQFVRESAESDCGIGFFATPGAVTRWGQPATGPQFCVYCYPLPAAEFHQIQADGFRVAVSKIEDVAPASWPKDVKIRSRLHYYLADLSVRDQGLTALLADCDGNLRDTSVAAPVFVFDRHRLTIPPRDSILDSVGLQYLVELGRAMDFEIERREVHCSEIDGLLAMLLTNSLFGLAPVSHIESRVLEKRSPEWQQLAGRWSAESGMQLHSVSPKVPPSD